MRARGLTGVAAALLAAGEVSVRYLEPSLPTHRLWYDTLPAIRMQQMQRLRRVDVVFCGHSMMHCGVQPTTVLTAAGRPDLRGYNAGLHRGFYGVVGPFLVDAVIPTLRPRTVVLGASVFDLNDNGALLHDTRVRYEQALLGRQDVVGTVARSLAARSALFRNARTLLRPRRLAAAVQARLTGREIVDEDVRDSRHNVGEDGEWLGYSARGFHTTDRMREHLVVGGLGDFHAGGREASRMVGWIRRIRELGPEVVLVLMPPSSQLWAELPDGGRLRSEVVARLREVARDAGVELLEPKVDLVDEEHYADLAHLNAAGMQRFSEAVGVSLGEALAAGRVRLASGRSPTAP